MWFRNSRPMGEETTKVVGDGFGCWDDIVCVNCRGMMIYFMSLVVIFGR